MKVSTYFFSLVVLVLPLSLTGCSDDQPKVIEADESTQVSEDYEAMSYGDSNNQQ